MKTAQPFQLIAGNVALDLVNTIDNRFDPPRVADLLASYDDLLRFLAQSSTLTATQARRLATAARKQGDGGQLLDQVRHLREALSEVAYAMVDGKRVASSALGELEAIFKRCRNASTLFAEGGRTRWKLQDPSGIAASLWILAREAETFLLSGPTTQLRACDVESCRWLFLDISKSHSRRWCDMKICGNRVKARKFHARAAGK